MLSIVKQGQENLMPLFCKANKIIVFIEGIKIFEKKNKHVFFDENWLKSTSK